MVSVASIAPLLQLGSPLLAVGAAAASHSTPLALHSKAPRYRTFLSYPLPDVSSDYLDPTMPQLITDLYAGLAVELPVYAIAMATVNGRTVLGDLFIAFTCKCGAQFMKSFQSVFMEDFPRCSSYSLHNICVAFVAQSCCGYRLATLTSRTSVHDEYGYPPQSIGVPMHRPGRLSCRPGC